MEPRCRNGSWLHDHDDPILIDCFTRAPGSGTAGVMVRVEHEVMGASLITHTGTSDSQWHPWHPWHPVAEYQACITALIYFQNPTPPSCSLPHQTQPLSPRVRRQTGTRADRRSHMQMPSRRPFLLGRISLYWIYRPRQLSNADHPIPSFSRPKPTCTSGSPELETWSLLSRYQRLQPSPDRRLRLTFPGSIYARKKK